MQLLKKNWFRNHIFKYISYVYRTPGEAYPHLAQVVAMAFFLRPAEVHEDSLYTILEYIFNYFHENPEQQNTM